MGKHSRWYSLMHNEIYLGRDRLDEKNPSKKSLPIGGSYVDWGLSKVRLTRQQAKNSLRISSTPGNKSGSRLHATDQVFNKLLSHFASKGPKITTVNEIAVRKEYFAAMSFRAKTEAGFGGSSGIAGTGTSWLPRFNPKVFLNDFYTYSEEERDRMPFEVYVLFLENLLGSRVLESNNGRAFFGPSWISGEGQTSIVTHSVPREPLISLGAFQHSMANGFLFQQAKETPGNGFGTLNTRDPLNPQISHAIGNSEACAVIPPEDTFAIMNDGSGRPLADHSYLANRGLWDDWFLSSIAPMPAGNFFSGKTQNELATEFFEGTGELPNRRYVADLGSLTSTEAVNKLFDAAVPRAEAKDIAAALLRVEGMFNVNSTSVDAWKSVLSGLREETVGAIGDNGTAKTVAATTETTPITGLLNPLDEVAGDPGDRAAWMGRRELTDGQIDTLARAITREVRLSGPFLSLADFVNRRPGSGSQREKVAGVIARALDEGGADLNDAFRDGDAVVDSDVADRFAFPEAEEKLKSDGIPGIVKQADILTPIAPFISVRSDSFLVRAYGEAVDGSGKVTAKAWCEARVERDRSFVDPADKPETQINALTKDANKIFGRKFMIRSFRWLHPDEV